MTLASTEAALRALLLGREPTWLAGVDRRRQRVYRDLVRSNLLNTIERACPHARRLHRADFDDVAARFLAEAPPTTRLVRDVPAQFTAWLMQQEPATLPSSARSGAFGELCHFEALEIEVTMSETGRHQTAGAVVDDAVFLLDPSARLALYRHPVHRVTSTTTALPAAAAQPVVLLCFQRAEQFVVDVVSPAVAKLLVCFSQGQTLGAGLGVLRAEAAAAGTVVDVARVRADLVDLRWRGALFL